MKLFPSMNLIYAFFVQSKCPMYFMYADKYKIA
jgi:hypothetical protein